MIDRIADAVLDDLEMAMDYLDSAPMRNVFLGELLDRKADMLEALVDKGGDEMRFKIQMIDEVINLREEIGAELKARKGLAE